jgi:hypothetical protein
MNSKAQTLPDDAKQDYMVMLSPEKPIGPLFYRDVTISEPGGPNHLLATLYKDPKGEYLENRVYDIDSIDDMKRVFTESEGRYTRYAGCETPFKQIDFMVNHNIRKFVGCSITESVHDGVSYWDVRGNLLNCHLPFWYRFFTRRSLDVWIFTANHQDPTIKL